MRHAFLFISHNNSRNMAEAIAALDSPDSDFFIHIDKKANLQDNKELARLAGRSNITILQERVSVNWGGFSLFLAIEKIMAFALKNSKADYFHLLSDSCYPIKPKDEIYNFFEANNGCQYLEYMALPSKEWPYGGLDRIAYYRLHDIIPVKKNKLTWAMDKNLMLLQKHLHLKRDIGTRPYYGGSAWWSLSRQAVAHCINDIENTPNFFRRYQHSFAFEECCIQTILVNSPFKDNIINDDLRYVDWALKNGNIPANIDETDFDKLIASTDLFGRKFTPQFGNGLRLKLQESLHHARFSEQ